MEQPHREKYFKSLIWTLVAAIPLFILALYQVHGMESAGFAGVMPFIKGYIARFAFVIYSFLIGEFIQPWDFYLSTPALLCMFYLVYLAMKAKNDTYTSLIKLTLAIALPIGVLALTIIGIGIEFSASRLTFLAPFFLIFLVTAPFRDGIKPVQKYIGIVVVVILIGLNVLSTANYHRGVEYIQSTYIIPWEEIASDIDFESGEEFVILHDDDTLNYWLPIYPENFPESYNLHAVESGLDLDQTDPVDLVYAIFSPAQFSEDTIESIIQANYGTPELISEKDYLVEDVTSVRWKSMLLGREISKVKKKLIIYNIGG